MLTVYRGLGIDLKAALEICKSGFANLSLRNDGWFGNGVYFTPDLDCAKAYASESGLVLVCNILLFQPYPVIENFRIGPKFAGFYGQPIVPGCDAHVAVVKHFDSLHAGDTIPLPPSEWIGEGHTGPGGGTFEMSTEIVMSDLHVLPRCILKWRT